MMSCIKRASLPIALLFVGLPAHAGIIRCVVKPLVPVVKATVHVAPKVAKAIVNYVY